MRNQAAKAFSERLAFWTSEGLQGAEVYERLASDNELPASFTTEEAAAIQGITPQAVKKQRHRNCGPGFMRFPKAVRYPRPDLCRYLASRYVKRVA